MPQAPRLFARLSRPSSGISRCHHSFLSSSGELMDLTPTGLSSQECLAVDKVRTSRLAAAPAPPSRTAWSSLGTQHPGVATGRGLGQSRWLLRAPGGCPSGRAALGGRSGPGSPRALSTAAELGGPPPYLSLETPGAKAAGIWALQMGNDREGRGAGGAAGTACWGAERGPLPSQPDCPQQGHPGTPVPGQAMVC